MRILIASGGPRASEAKALVEACRLDRVSVETRTIAGPSDLARTEGIDLLLVAEPDARVRMSVDPLEMARRELPIMLLVSELTAEDALFSSRCAAPVSLFRHGPGPLREAIVRRLEARRAHDERRRKELDEVLRASEQIRALVNVSVNDVVFALRVEGGNFRYLEVNPAFTEATGIGAEQVVGKLIDEVIPEPSLSLVKWKLREAIEERHTVRWDEVTEYPAGRRHQEVSITPVLFGDGRVTKLLGTSHDTTAEHEQSEAIQRYANIVEAVQIGLTAWTVADPDPASIVLGGANPAASALLGLDDARANGQPMAELLPAPMAGPLAELIAEVARTGEVRENPEVWTGGPKHRVLSVKAFPLPGLVGLAIEDVSEQVRMRELNAAGREILEKVATGATLGETLIALVMQIERLAPPAIAAVLLVTAEGDRLTLGAAPHLPRRFQRALEGLPIGASTALERPIVVSDVETDPRWREHRELAREHGLRAIWATPLLSTQRRVLGTIALYYREPHAPSDAERELVTRAEHVASIAIHRFELDEQLRELTARVETAREEERTGIARELHDELGQSLTAIKLDLAFLARRLEGRDGVAALIEKLHESMRLTDETIGQLRRISAELRPAVLDEVGLGSALAWQANEFEKRTHTACSVQSAVPDRAMKRDVATTVFRVFQEALTNVARHAEAEHVEARLAERDGALVLEVSDDGRGIAPEKLESPRSLGLVGMRERARRLGGSVRVTPVRPHGTRVTLRLPESRVRTLEEVAS
jgi:PAS domain S-box-containing protein